MKTNRLLPLLILTLSTLNPQLSTLFAQGTAFTYQGRLNDGANPANGRYDLKLGLFNAATNGTLVSSDYATNSATTVSGGLFTVTLDFGDVFAGPSRWLEIAVRTNGGGAFSTLSPRQQLTPIPYAIRAATANFATSANHATSADSANHAASALRPYLRSTSRALIPFLAEAMSSSSSTQVRTGILEPWKIVFVSAEN